MKIQMIRHTQEAGLVADVWMNERSILTVSIPIDECTQEALVEYAINDQAALEAEERKALQIVLDNSFTPDEEPWNTIPDSVTVTKPAWMIEAEARANDEEDLQNTIQDAQDKPVFGGAAWFAGIDPIQF